MSNLSNQYISASFQSLLNLQGAGSGLTANLQVVQDGFGQNTPMSVSTTQVAISSLTGSVAITGSLIPGANNIYDLGAPGAQFRHLYVSSGSVWMDDNQILSLGDVGANTQLYSPPSGSIIFRNDIVLDNPSAEFGTTFNILGNGAYKQANINFQNTENAYVNVNSGNLFITNNEGGIGSGSIGVRALNNGNITIQTDEGIGSVFISSTTGSVNLYTFNDGNIVLQNQGSGSIGINSNTKVDITSNVLITGSLNQTGTFYADAITFSESPSIQQTTGSYIMTYDSTGMVAYDTYNNVGAAISPYITGGSGSSGTSGTSGGDTGSFATTGSNTFAGNQTISGSIYTNGAITFSDSAFNSTTNISGALYFSSLNGGTLHLNDDGGEGDVYVLNGQGSQIHINGNEIISGSLTVQDNLINILGSSPTLNLQLNEFSSGSQYPNINVTVDSAATPADIFGGLNLTDTNGSLGMGFIYDSYTTEYFGTSVGQIYAGLPNDNASNTAIIFPSGSASMEVYKPTTFFYPSQNLQGFAQQQLITTQTIGSSSDTVITFNHTDFDPSGWYNSEYFYYQPTVAGTYQVSYGVNFEDAGIGTGQINVQIRQNETGSVNINQTNLNVGYNQTLTGTYFVQMNGTTDILDLSAYSSVGQDILASNGTFLNIKLL